MPEEQKKIGIGIQKIFVKDLSFESPNLFEVLQGEWKPLISLEMNIESQNVGKDFFEVILKLTVTNKINDKTAFLVEVKQAGIFALPGFTEEQLKPILGIACPNILFPYVREVISDVTSRGGFPPLYLEPINFEDLYNQHQGKGDITTTTH